MDKEEEELNELIERLENGNTNKTITNKDKEYQEELSKLEQEKEETLKSIKKLSRIRIYGCIGCLILILLIKDTFARIMFIIIALCSIALPATARQRYSDIENEMKKKEYEYEHSPEKELERKERELQEDIYRTTPFKSLNEIGDYHIAGISWNLIGENKLKNINVILESEQQGTMKNLFFKYDKKEQIVNAPLGTTEEYYLNIIREKIYTLKYAGKYEEANQIFREIFGKDPFTGEDIITANKD